MTEVMGLNHPGLYEGPGLKDTFGAVTLMLTAAALKSSGKDTGRGRPSALWMACDGCTGLQTALARLGGNL